MKSIQCHKRLSVVVRKQMMPNGQIMVDDRNYDAVSQGTLIEEETPIMVVTADGNRILVRPVPARTGETLRMGVAGAQRPRYR